MGNSLASCGIAIKGHKKVQVMRADGKMLEFRAPILVQDILANFSGCHISLSNKDTEHLPDNYELKAGDTYYVVSSYPSASFIKDMEENDGVKRIKVVLTKQELQQLLANKVSVSEVLSGAEQRACCQVDSPRDWRPKLDAIPEGNE